MKSGSYFVPIPKKLLKRNGFVKRKMQKSKATSKHQDRNQQFEKIFEGKENCENEGVPVISVDSKKAEKIRDLHSALPSPKSYFSRNVYQCKI